MGKIIIVERNQKLVLFLLDEKGSPSCIQTASLPKDDALLGNIYIGRVAEVVKGLEAAFVTINPELKVFLPFHECMQPMLVNREYDGQLKQGDEILVQITSQALKTKPPGASANLTRTGQYCVCTKNGHGIAYSKKLSKAAIETLKTHIKQMELPGRKEYGFVVRTNAENLEQPLLLEQEMKMFIDFFEDINQIYQHRTCFSCLYQADTEIVTVIKDISMQEYEEVITDSREVYELLKPYQFKGLRLYQDTMISLTNLYSLETHLKQALAKKVWLPGGGYLIIEPTEAMIVIDVNSGKGSNHKNTAKNSTCLKNNSEAASEIARQLRLRNYSGMIMVDFINMETKDDQKRLMDFFDECLKRDKIKTRLVDMTELGIVEVTRKKVNKPLDISIL